MPTTTIHIPKDVWREHIAPAAEEEVQRRAFKEAVDKEANERVLAVVNDWRQDHYLTCCKGTDNPPISHACDFYACKVCRCDLPFRWWDDSTFAERCCTGCLADDPWECDECDYTNFGGTECDRSWCNRTRV